MPDWHTRDGDDILLGFRITIDNNVEEEFADMFSEIKDWQRRYLEEVAREIAERAKQIAPRQTGKLADSITYWEVEQDNSPENADRTEFAIGTDVFYGRFQEFGYNHRNGQRIPPNPFLRAALYDVGRKIDKQSVNRELNQFLRSRRGSTRNVNTRNAA